VNFADARLPERFWSKVTPEPNSGCWIWIASLGTSGYGQFSVENRPLKAYRVAYEALVGPVPDGLELDHLCRVRCCVNPAHLEPVTHAENMRRGDSFQRNKTHCPKGHPYDPSKSGNGRRCLPCTQASWTAYNRRKAVAA
jgi:hypothetical protein